MSTVSEVQEELILAGSNSCEDEFEWDDLCDELTYQMKEIAYKSGNWFVTVENFGWNNRDGFAHFHATTGASLLLSILPKTICNFEIYKVGKTLKIRNWHHDSPTGNEYYTINPFNTLNEN